LPTRAIYEATVDEHNILDHGQSSSFSDVR